MIGRTVKRAVQARTSYGMFIPRYQDEIVARLEERVAEWTGIPVSHQEDIQVLRYAEGQQYKPHMDANGRICTVLVYLVGAVSPYPSRLCRETACPLGGDRRTC